MEGELDFRMRSAAFEHVRRLNATHDFLSSRDLSEGFTFEGTRVPLVNPQRGIFKPKRMRYLLSIRTVFPRPGARVWYDDQRQIHRQIYQSEELVDYAFMGTNPDAADNRWLKEACEQRIPIIYFIGVAPGRFQAQVPAFIAGWDRSGLKASVGFGEPATTAGMPFPDEQPARRYALSIVKQRLHQATFRQAVLAAYDDRCALTGLPEPMLLDAAHIARYRTLILPNIAALSNDQCRQLTDFVRAGGNLVATHETSLYDEWGVRRANFGLAPLFSATFDGRVDSDVHNSYLNIEKDPKTGEFHPIVAGLEDASRIINGETAEIYIRGSEVREGKPKTVVLAPHHIAEALEAPIEQIAEFIQHAIEDIPAEISTDICERGIYLSGGGSKLAKLDQELERRIGVKCHLPEKPEQCVITGSATLLRSLKEREHLLIKP